MSNASACPNHEVCGSCSWSHIPYQKQLLQKLSDINGSFRLKDLHFECKDILPSPQQDHYRNRMDFVIDFEGRVGMRQKGKWWKVIDNHTCFLSDRKIESLFSTVRQWTRESGLSYYDRKSHLGFLRYAVIRNTKYGDSLVNLVTSAPSDSEEELHARKALTELAGRVPEASLVWAVNNTKTDVSQGDALEVISGKGLLEERFGELRYEISPQAFFQTNSHAAALLLETVKEYCGDLSGKTLLDLYCGSGFFAVSLARHTARTVGVELVAEAIADARRNAEINGVKIDFFDAKTESFDWEKYNADIVILDPPRSGMHDNALKDVLRILPPKIVYVSCNYKNFAREMVELQRHYDLVQIKAIDMFPHTPHVELVSELRLKN